MSKADIVIDELPPGARVVEARITTDEDADEGSGPADLLPLDDAAWAVVPPDRLRRVLLVGPGNVYLQNAFSLLPNVELYGATADEYAATTGKDLFDLDRLRRLPAGRPAARSRSSPSRRRNRAPWARSTARSTRSAWASPPSTIRCCAAST